MATPPIQFIEGIKLNAPIYRDVIAVGDVEIGDGIRVDGDTDGRYKTSTNYSSVVGVAISAATDGNTFELQIDGEFETVKVIGTGTRNDLLTTSSISGSFETKSSVYQNLYFVALESWTESGTIKATKALNSKYIASEAIVGDYYQPMIDGNDGDLLTPTMMQNGDIIRLEDPTITAVYSIPNGGVWVSKALDTELPCPVVVDGTQHIINSGLSWSWLNEFTSKYVTIAIENSFSSTQFYDQMTIGCYLQIGDGEAENFHDIIKMDGTFDVTPEFCVAQVHGTAGNLKMNVHTNGPDGSDIDIVGDKWYWVVVLFDGVNEVAKLSIFDPANGFNEIAGSPSTATIQADRQVIGMGLCRTSGHGNNPTNTGTSHIAQIVIRFDDKPILPVIQ